MKSNKQKGNEFESKCKKTIGSGQFWFSKGDLQYKDYVIECKFTDKKGFRITLNILEKLWKEALEAQKEPILEIGIRRNENEIFKLQCLVTTERMK